MTIGGESLKDRPIYVRVQGFEKDFWYVIEEKSLMESALSSANEVIGCESETDRVRRLPLPDSFSPTNNFAVVNSCAYLIGGDGCDESVGFRHIDLTNICKLIWCKFTINICDTSTSNNPRFSANSLSRGFCPLDENTFQVINSAVGM